MLEYSCLQQTSLVFNSLGTVLLLFVNTRGTDLGGRPSFFFFEFTIARFVLGITWSLTHLLMSVSSGRTSRLVLANAILDGLRALVQIIQLLWHRHWCVGEAWRKLRQRSALQILTLYVIFGSLVSTISGAVNNAFLYHDDSQRLYYVNIVAQTLDQLGCVMLVYLNRGNMHRGYVWYTFFICCTWSVCFLGIMTYIFNQRFDMPIEFTEPFGYIGLVVQWTFCSIMSFLFHAFDPKTYSGPGSADDTPIELKEEMAMQPTSALSTPRTPRSSFSPTPAMTDTDFAIVPSSSSGCSSSSTVDSPPGCVDDVPAVSSPVQMTERVNLHSSFNDQPTSDSKLAVIVKDFDTPKPRSDSPSIPVKDFQPLEISDSRTGSTPTKMLQVAVTSKFSAANASVHIQSWVEDNQDLANPSLMQLHKLLVSFSNWLMFGAVIGLCDAAVANIFSDLPRCSQLDPFRNEWADALKTLFDLLT
jgi:hypothetical protein